MLAFRLNNGVMCEFAQFGEEALEAILTIEQRASAGSWSRQNFLDSIHSSHLCFAAYHTATSGTENILGFTIFSLAAGEAELLLISVDPQFQRLGVAKSMLQAAQTILEPKARELFLEVRESNRRAIGLYEKLDFNCIGRRSNYYPARAKGGPREDALIYAKHICVMENG